MSRITRGAERITIEIKSRNVTTEQAWKTTQDQLRRDIPGYPEDFQDFQDTIKDVFVERRRAHLANTSDDRLAINRAISHRVLALEEPIQSTLVPVFQAIRNLFEVKNPPRRTGR